MAAGTGLVGVVVEDGVTCSTDSGQEETSGDTGDGTVSYVPFAEKRV